MSMFYLPQEAKQSRQTGTVVRLPCKVCKRAANAERIAPMRAILDKMKTDAGCADCGVHEVEHPEIYDFDHLPGTDKRYNISQLIQRLQLDEALEEAKKCEVVCSNCHRKRTRRRERESAAKLSL